MKFIIYETELKKETLPGVGFTWSRQYTAGPLEQLLTFTFNGPEPKGLELNIDFPDLLQNHMREGAMIYFHKALENAEFAVLPTCIDEPEVGLADEPASAPRVMWPEHRCDGCDKLWTEGQPDGHWWKVRDSANPDPLKRVNWLFLCPACTEKRDLEKQRLAPST